MKVSFGAEMAVTMAWRESSDVLLLATRFLSLEGKAYCYEHQPRTVDGTHFVKDCSFVTETHEG